MNEQRNQAQLLESEKLHKTGMSSEETLGFLSGCVEYERALVLLRKYDENQETLDSKEGSEEDYALTSAKATLVIKELKSYLAKRGENVELFGVPRNGGVELVVGNVYQTYGGKDLYPCVEDKAVHLFYLLIKDHLFVDGNKRIASFLFLWYLEMNNILAMTREARTISYNTIYALAIFVAESNAKDKDIIIQLIRNLVMTREEALPDE